MKSGPGRGPVLQGLRSPPFLRRLPCHCPFLRSLQFLVPLDSCVCWRPPAHSPPPPSFFIPGALAAASWPSSILCCSIKSLPENKGPALLYQAAGASGKQGRQPLISCHGLFLSALISCPGLHPVQNVAGIRRRAPKAAWIATVQTVNSSCCEVYAHKPQGNSHMPVWSDLTCLERSPPTVGGGCLCSLHVDRAREGQTLAARSDSRLSPARTEKEKNK